MMAGQCDFLACPFAGKIFRDVDAGNYQTICLCSVHVPIFSNLLQIALNFEQLANMCLMPTKAILHEQAMKARCQILLSIRSRSRNACQRLATSMNSITFCDYIHCCSPAKSSVSFSEPVRGVDGQFYFCSKHLMSMRTIYERFRIMEDAIEIKSMEFLDPSNDRNLSVINEQVAALGSIIKDRGLFRSLLNETHIESEGHEQWISNLCELLIDRIKFMKAKTLYMSHCAQ
jgi:hypothetical protein